MKTKLSYLFLIAVCALNLASFFGFRRGFPLNPRQRGDLDYAFDFHLRMNEIECLKQGVNPLDVWSEKIDLHPFVPLGREDLWSPERPEIVNAYTPWEYVMMMPFSLLPRSLAWNVYNYGQLAALFAIAFLSFAYAGRRVDRPFAGALAAGCALLVGLAAWEDFQLGNFGIFIALAIVGMLFSLEGGHDVWAGVFWAIAMIKPQISVLLAIPLLYRRKFATCLVAATICLACTAVSAMLCHEHVADLLLNITRGSTPAFLGCGLLPYNVRLLFSQAVSNERIVAILFVVQILLCAVMTAACGKRADWFSLAVPAIVCAVTGNYSVGPNFCALCVPLLVATIWLLKHGGSGRMRRAVPVVVMLLALRPYDLFSFVVLMAGGVLARSGLWTSGPIPRDETAMWGHWFSLFLLVATAAFVVVCLRKLPIGTASPEKTP